MKRKHSLKLVSWHDSRGAGSQWKMTSEVKADGICSMQSVGWLIAETKKHICIAPHMGIEDDGDHQVCGEMHIPKSCIDKIQTIKP
jgi:hypothetical protein